MIYIKDFVDKIYCINLKKRRDRKLFMLHQGKEHNLNITFFDAIYNKKGWIGCLKSHLEILKMARKKKYKKILILEDDCDIKSDLILKEKPPKDWEMIYLGGQVKQILEDNHFEVKEKFYVKANILSTHAMIINHTVYDKLINLIIKCERPIDQTYANYHYNKKCYITNPMMIIQINGYSDIESSEIEYNYQPVTNYIEMLEAPSIKDENGFRLLLDPIEDKDLPYISILTPTKNRKKLFPLAIHNFQNSIYPKEKIEWIILDDSDNGDDLTDILPKDNRIKYKKINPKFKLTVGQKRNICVKLAKYDILVNMDDDDYYFPCHLLSRVKVLLKYPKINLVGSGQICVYDVHDQKYFLCGNTFLLGEATMAFRRSFWNEKKFGTQKFAEGTIFIHLRKEQCYRIPFSFILCVMNHKKNITSGSRKDGVKFTDYKLPKSIINLLNKIYNNK
jgi:GR25 family glycosyltransferase involved in LPS biosynthesis